MGATDGVGMYRSGRERAVELGRSLTEDQGRTIVPATPQWSVKDNFAHMAGVADDLLNGRLEGVTSDPWTAAQVDARRDRSLAEVLDEMEALGPAMDALVDALGEAVDPRLFMDQWTHEQDVRGALGVPGGTDAEVVAWSAPSALKAWSAGIGRSGLAAITLRCGDVEVVTGEDPVGSLTVDAFTALRVLTGRRSRAQLAELHWEGVADPETYFEHLVVFTIAEHDVHDAR
jgi:hypothetical protein